MAHATWRQEPIPAGPPALLGPHECPAPPKSVELRARPIRWVVYALAEFGTGTVSAVVDEGDYELTFDAAGLDCELFAVSGWDSDKPNSLRTRAVKGFLSHYNSAMCE